MTYVVNIGNVRINMMLDLCDTLPDELRNAYEVI